MRSAPERGAEHGVLSAEAVRQRAVPGQDQDLMGAIMWSRGTLCSSRISVALTHCSLLVAHRS